MALSMEPADDVASNLRRPGMPIGRANGPQVISNASPLPLVPVFGEQTLTLVRRRFVALTAGALH
jgi:hypothetical protein